MSAAPRLPKGDPARARSQLLRILGGTALAALLVAASWAPLVVEGGSSDSAQFQANLEHWLALPDGRREELRRLSRDFEALPEAERERYVQRLDVVRRMSATLRRISGRDPTDEELRQRLQEVRSAMEGWLIRTAGLTAPVDEAALRGAMERQVAVRIGAYLDRLVAAGRLEAADRAALAGLPSSLLIREALSVHALEQRRIAEEGGAALLPAVPEDPDDAHALLRIIDREEARKARAEQLELVELAGQAPSAGEDGGAELRRRMEKLRFILLLLDERGLSPKETETVLSLPMPELECALEALLGG